MDKDNMGAPAFADRAAGLRPQSAAPFSQSSIPSAIERVRAMSADPKALQWNIPANLRWLASNPGHGYLPCGMLHGVFLDCVAEAFEKYAAQAIEVSGEEK